MLNTMVKQAGSTATLEATDDVAERQRSNDLASTSGGGAPGQDFLALGVDDRLTVSTSSELCALLQSCPRLCPGYTCFAVRAFT